MLSRARLTRSKMPQSLPSRNHTRQPLGRLTWVILSSAMLYIWLRHMLDRPNLALIPASHGKLSITPATTD